MGDEGGGGWEGLGNISYIYWRAYSARQLLVEETIRKEAGERKTGVLHNTVQYESYTNNPSPPHPPPTPLSLCRVREGWGEGGVARDVVGAWQE